jgi:hypothetical protein
MGMDGSLSVGPQGAATIVTTRAHLGKGVSDQESGPIGGRSLGRPVCR